MIRQAFTRKIPEQAKWFFAFVVLPLYVYCSALILSALFKWLILTFSWSANELSMNAWLNIINDFVLLIIVGWILKETMVQQFKDFKLYLKSNLQLGLLIGPVIMYGVSFVGGFLTLILGGQADSENQILINQLLSSYPVMMILSAVVLAPIIEEMIFRGIIFGWAYEYNPLAAHIISAFLFGFVHIMSAVFAGNVAEWIQIIPYFLMGLTLSKIYERSNNIYVNILVHGIYNLISIMLVML